MHAAVEKLKDMISESKKIGKNILKNIHGNIFPKLILTDFKLHLTLLSRDICIRRQ